MAFNHFPSDMQEYFEQQVTEPELEDFTVIEGHSIANFEVKVDPRLKGERVDEVTGFIDKYQGAIAAFLDSYGYDADRDLEPPELLFHKSSPHSDIGGAYDLNAENGRTIHINVDSRLASRDHGRFGVVIHELTHLVDDQKEKLKTDKWLAENIGPLVGHVTEAAVAVGGFLLGVKIANRNTKKSLASGALVALASTQLGRIASEPVPQHIEYLSRPGEIRARRNEKKARQSF